MGPRENWIRQEKRQLPSMTCNMKGAELMYFTRLGNTIAEIHDLTFHWLDKFYSCLQGSPLYPLPIWVELLYSYIGTCREQNLTWLASPKLQKSFNQYCHFPERHMLSKARLLATWVRSKKKLHLLYVSTHTEVLHDMLFFEGQFKGIYCQREPFKCCWSLLPMPGPAVMRFEITSSCWSAQAQTAWETHTCLLSLW